MEQTAQRHAQVQQRLSISVTEVAAVSGILDHVAETGQRTTEVVSHGYPAGFRRHTAAVQAAPPGESRQCQSVIPMFHTPEYNAWGWKRPLQIISNALWMDDNSVKK
ncbi:MAG: hypothetical protein RJQ08_10705 [Salinisphaeraceae bacterium]